LFGKRQKRWSLALLAEVCSEQGLIARDISREGQNWPCNWALPIKAIFRASFVAGRG
jgi:hypothetical protein